MNDRYDPGFPAGTDSSKMPKPPPEIPAEFREDEGEVIETTPASDNSRPGVRAKAVGTPAIGDLPPGAKMRPETSGAPADQKGKVTRRELTPSEANWAMGCHLAAIFGYISFIGFVVGPLVVWFLKKNEDAFVDEQGKEAVNFQLSMILYYIGAAILSLVLIGIPILIGLFIFQLVEIILASVKAKNGYDYRYPMTIRFIS